MSRIISDQLPCDPADHPSSTKNSMKPTNEPTTSIIDWKPTNEAVPRSVVQVLAVDPQARLLVMHRGPNVRSARNVWSFPSGMHEIGEGLAHGGAREMLEEYGLHMDAHKALSVGVYENIAGDPDADQQWHWVINVIAMRCPDVTAAVNREPDKHDRMEFIPIFEILREDFLLEYPFHASFIAFFRKQRMTILNALCAVAEGNVQ